LEGLIGNGNNGDDDDVNNNGLELTEARSWRRRKEAGLVHHGSLVAADTKNRRAKFLFAVAMLLYATFAILNVLDPKHLAQRQRQQIRNYRSGNALILNLHIRSHGGTAVSNAIGKAPNTTGCPSVACNHPDPNIADGGVNMTLYPDYNPWEHNMTARNIAIVRRNFHFIGWEYATIAPEQPLSITNWAGTTRKNQLF
jgi:hypothetical protein